MTVEDAPIEPLLLGDEPEDTGRTVAPLEGSLDDYAGHGTFIAGILRQTCPEAEIVMIKVMGPDGFVPEETMVRAIAQVAVDHGSRTRPIDALSLSFGYYHEEPEDKKTDATLIGPVTALVSDGVAVFASAGNDATTRRMYPAAFSTTIGLVSVGARTSTAPSPCSATAGTGSAPGNAVPSLPSTQPTTFDGALQPAARWWTPDRRLPASCSIPITSATGSPPGPAPRSRRRPWRGVTCGG